MPFIWHIFGYFAKNPYLILSHLSLGLLMFIAQSLLSKTSWLSESTVPINLHHCNPYKVLVHSADVAASQGCSCDSFSMTLCTFKRRKRICTYLSHIYKDFIIILDYVRLSRNLYIHYVRLSTSLFVLHSSISALALPWSWCWWQIPPLPAAVAGLLCESENLDQCHCQWSIRILLTTRKMHKKSEFYQSTCQIGDFYTKCLDLTFSYQNENLTTIVGISEIYSEKTHLLHIYCVNSHHNTTLQYTLQRTDPSVIVNASPLTQLVLSLFTRAFLQNSIPSSNFLQQTDSACTLSLPFNDCLQK